MRKILLTLNVNDYQPAIRSLTFPLMKSYAQKIGAEFGEITERKYPDWPIVMEKFQVADIARDYDWSIFVDADALISPEFFDVTTHLSKDQVCFNGKDFSQIRSYPDKYFQRDGRYIGACDWFCVCSDWTRDDLYSFPEFGPEQAQQFIFASINEHNSGMFRDGHLIDDYTLSRNIARFGLKHDTNIDICGRLGFRGPQGQPFNPFLHHLYAIPEAEKINRMLDHLARPQDQGGWAMMKPEEVGMFKAHWKLA